MKRGVHIEDGFREAHRDAAACGFWAAFGAKLRWPLGPSDKALAFIAANLDPDDAISAVDGDGAFLGIAGFKTPQGAFVGGGLRELRPVYGGLGSLWRGGLLGVLERDCEPGTLLMDGIFVRADARGRGVGTSLLDAVVRRARTRGLDHVRLDVVDGNDRARALYERRGFKAVRHASIGPLRRVFGFAGATIMMKTVRRATDDAGGSRGYGPRQRTSTNRINEPSEVFPFGT